MTCGATSTSTAVAERAATKLAGRERSVAAMRQGQRQTNRSASSTRCRATHRRWQLGSQPAAPLAAKSRSTRSWRSTAIHPADPASTSAARPASCAGVESTRAPRRGATSWRWLRRLAPMASGRLIKIHRWTFTIDHAPAAWLSLRESEAPNVEHFTAIPRTNFHRLGN